ncbi:MAG TPA: beta galactosidase jelly roll domain-containing protein, partial [Verrucomicrobiae bacterium]|nr:beta galactosidase jelly roll domain-containing protein [Verrucomicrobiae bacterium]
MKPRFLFCLALATFATGACAADETYSPPASPRFVYNFNPDWKFIRQDGTNAETADFDDSKWTTVSTPHTFNDTDSYDHIISHSGGDRHAWTGIVWYRKHFKLPARDAGDKIFLEFEGIRQAARFWVNGHFVGLYENGVTPCGLDLTRFVKFGEADNVVAVKVDNRTDYKEAATGVPFEWEGRAFNPDYGGLHSDERLILTGKIYQTLPLYENLKTSGTYIYPSNFNIQGHTCDLNIESQVRNESGKPESITLWGLIVDADGKPCAKFQTEALNLAAGQTEVFTASCKLKDGKFWSDVSPNLYDVHTMLSVDGRVVDAQKIRTGFRKTEFKGGVGTGGVY